MDFGPETILNLKVDLDLSFGKFHIEYKALRLKNSQKLGRHIEGQKM